MTPGLLARLRVLLAAPPGREKRAARSRRRSARAAVSSGVLFALAAMVGMSAAVETVKPEWRDPEYGHRLHRLRRVARESPDRPLVLTLGTSRTENAIDPAATGFPAAPGSPRVFNFGQSGSSPLRVMLTLYRLLDEGFRPAAVVVEVLPVWLVSDGAAEKEFAGAAGRLSAGDLARLGPYCKRPGALRAQWIEARVAPWYAQRLPLMSHWLPRWLSWPARLDFRWENVDADGFSPYPFEEPPPHIRATAVAHARDSYSGNYSGFRVGPTSVRALGDVAARCRAEGVLVAFAEPPVSPMFRGWYRPGVWEGGDDRLRALAAELGVELFPPGGGLAEEDFVDGHHMLRRGAAKYSRWLADTHLKPWLARNGR
jgi:hypothetical protein